MANPTNGSTEVLRDGLMPNKWRHTLERHCGHEANIQNTVKLNVFSREYYSAARACLGAAAFDRQLVELTDIKPDENTRLEYTVGGFRHRPVKDGHMIFAVPDADTVDAIKSTAYSLAKALGFGFNRDFVGTRIYLGTEADYGTIRSIHKAINEVHTGDVIQLSSLRTRN